MLLFVLKTAYASFFLKFILCITSTYFCQSIRYQAVKQGNLGDARARHIKFCKSISLDDDIRNYLLVTRETIHGNRTTVFIRFFPYGDNLYLGLDVFTLGALNWGKFIFKIWITFQVLSIIWSVILSFVSLMNLGIVWLQVFVVIATFIITNLMWWKLVWRMIYERKIGLAFLQEFPSIGGGPFDHDDVFMFAKSTVHLAVNAIHEVFEEEDLPLKSLDDFRDNINYITNVNVNSGIINMINSAIGNSNK